MFTIYLKKRIILFTNSSGKIKRMLFFMLKNSYSSYSAFEGAGGEEVPKQNVFLKVENIDVYSTLPLSFRKKKKGFRRLKPHVLDICYISVRPACQVRWRSTSFEFFYISIYKYRYINIYIVTGILCTRVSDVFLLTLLVHRHWSFLPYKTSFSFCCFR